ncbi:unnamed protein product, partial [Ectocarpus sp. 12 AP-2014]
DALKKVQEEAESGGGATVGRLDRGKKPVAAVAAAAAEAGTRSRGSPKAAAGGSAAAVAMAGEGGEGEGVGVGGSSPTRRVPTTGWGENDSQNGPGSVKDRLGAFSSGGRASGSSSALAASQGDVVATAPGSGAEGVEAGAPTAEAFPADQGFGADKKSALGTKAAAATGAATEAATGAVQEGGRRVQTGGWGEKGDRTGPGSIKQRLGAFLSRGSKNRSSKGREAGGGGGGVAGHEASSSGSRPPARGSVHDSVPDVPSVVEKSGAGTAAGAVVHANSGKKGPGSIKPRLEAFTSAGTFSSGGSSSSSGRREGADAGAGAGDGTSGKRSP